MGLNALSIRAVLLLIDEIESIAGMGHTASMNSVDKAAAALVNLAKLFTCRSSSAASRGRSAEAHWGLA
jgi:hypothetical protein